MRNERICLMCGTHYSFCPHCKESKPDEMWRFLYHDRKCLELSDLWHAYRGNEISKKEAQRKMSELKPNIDDVLKYTSGAAREIREIFDIDGKTEEVKDVDVKEEESILTDEQLATTEGSEEIKVSKEKNSTRTKASRKK